MGIEILQFILCGLTQASVTSNFTFESFLLLQDMIQTGMKHCLNNELNLAQIHVILGKGHDKHSGLCSFGVN